MHAEAKKLGKTGLVWLRRDLRVHDHPALAESLKDNDTTYVVFVFDSEVLNPIRKYTTVDTRLHFIAESLAEIQQELNKAGGQLIVLEGNPITEIPELVTQLGVDTLYFNRDYAPYATDRDAYVSKAIQDQGKLVRDFRDHVCMEPNDVLNLQGLPYKVFTPYSKAWKKTLSEQKSEPDYTVKLTKLGETDKYPILDTVEALLDLAGFQSSPAYLKGGSQAGLTRLQQFAPYLGQYKANRDFPALDKTSMLSVYIRHGCISVRDMLSLAMSESNVGAETWLNELIWREFYQMIAYHYPHVKGHTFQEKYRDLEFPYDEQLLQAWKDGMTGFPIVDAAMRCFNETGWMHNRLRMVVSSFFCKILLLDWRHGERYFRLGLLDYEFASNNGGWQWAAGTGCDAAPYFRIFNPTTQSQKFDKEGKFIRQWCPELNALDNKSIHEPHAPNNSSSSLFIGNYPAPIVDYKSRRQEALALYKSVQP